MKSSSSSPASRPREAWGRTGIAILVAAVLLGGALRFYDLGGPSFSEDELFKVNAVTSYRAGRWVATGDDEHPMLMKLLIYVSYGIRDAWNSNVAGDNKVLEVGLESATRGPNAFFGTMFVILLAFLGRELFSRRVGLVAALLWAVEVNVVGYNRIAKEDTLLAFFLGLALYFTIRAKRTAEAGDPRATRYQIVTAMSLGALLASKYFPHLALIVPLFYGFSRWMTDTSWRIPVKRWMALMGVVVATFLVLNPTVLHPTNLSYILDYMGHRTVYTHGYLFMGDIHMNNAFEGLSGTPWYFWFVYLGVKLSLPILFAALVGLGYALWRRREDGARLIFVWLIAWLTVHALLSGAKWGRFVTHLMPAVLLLGAVGLDAMARLASRGLARIRTMRLAVPAGVSLAVLVVPVLVGAGHAAWDSAPHYRMYLNAIGGRAENLRSYFPHCDFYDVGLREAVQYVCARAESGAQLRADAPEAVRYYVERCQRRDILVTSLSKPDDACLEDRPCYQILQVGRTYYETKPIFETLHRQRAPDAVVWARGVNVAEIYGPGITAGHQYAIRTAGEALRLGALARAFGNAVAKQEPLAQARPAVVGREAGMRVAALGNYFRFAGDVVVVEAPPRQVGPASVER